jgi:OmpA-OmpF porin, OOP family
MIRSQNRLWMVAAPIILALAASGCASKKYVQNQVNPVKNQLASFETKTNNQIAYLNNQQKRDTSQLNERIDTTDQRVSEVAAAVQQAQGTASRAMEMSSANSSKIAETSVAVDTLGTGVANALNFQLVQQADVNFGFNRSNLTPAAMATLDQVAQKMQSMPRSVVELAGFTDPVGSKAYNLALSRRRAWAVQRYLISKGIPVRNIQLVGMGKDQMAPSHLAGPTERSEATNRAERHGLERRVYIRVYGAGDITGGTASRSDQ